MAAFGKLHCGATTFCERQFRADSAMQVDLSVELKDRSVDLYFCSNE